MLTSRNMTPGDRIMAAGFLGRHYGGVFPVDFLPVNGVVVLNDEVPAVIIPIYMEASGTVAVPGHAIFNNDISPKILHQALGIALSKVIDFCRAEGRKYIISLYGRKSVNRAAGKLGFTDVDVAQEMFYLIRENE